jgi:hypothetical protein
MRATIACLPPIKAFVLKALFPLSSPSLFLAVFPLSKPSAHSEMCSRVVLFFFGGGDKNRTSLSEPKANSEER